MDNGWNFGGPPRNMKPGQIMERYGSLGGRIVQEYTKVPTENGDMVIQKTSEKIGGKPDQIGHATRHGEQWFDRYPKP
jgi:hypothetical protein